MKKLLVAAIASGTVLAASTFSYALEGCTCATMAVPGTKVLGTVTAVSGSVTVNGQPAEIGMKVASGFEMVTGKDSAAAMSVGSCGMDLGANSAADVSMTGPDVCVKVLKEGQLVRAEGDVIVEGASTQNNNTLPTIAAGPGLVVGTVVVIGGITYLVIEATDDDDNDGVSG